ncbi:MAG TPA: ABC transporter substrate-binding protein [Mycobacteriales bacterium]|nr:ABC transporter substrate-binding protein [Mycobacteriales bacterium]
MKIGSTRQSRLPAVAATAVLAVLAASCSSSPSSGGSTGSGGLGKATAPGVTGTSILLGSTQPLTGPASSGYDEIGPAINSFFQFVNSKGGVYNRKITFDYQDDVYDVTGQTPTVTRKLVLQDSVFAMVGALGTAPHESVVSFLNANRIPDLFVDTGFPGFNNVTAYPYTFSDFTDYVVEGKILGQYVTQHFAGQKVAYLGQADDLGTYGAKGLDAEIPAADVVAKKQYVPTATAIPVDVPNAIATAKALGAKVVVLFTIPAATATAVLTAAALNYHPQFVVSSVGSDPTTLDTLLKVFSKGKAGGVLDDGMITDGYYASASDTANQWTALFKQIHDQYDASQPFDGNFLNGVGIAYMTYRALKAAGPDLTRQGLVNAITAAALNGPNLAPLGFSSTSHAGIEGDQMGTISNNRVTLSGPVFSGTDTTAITSGGNAQTPVPTTW